MYEASSDVWSSGMENGEYLLPGGS